MNQKTDIIGLFNVGFKPTSNGFYNTMKDVGWKTTLKAFNVIFKPTLMRHLMSFLSRH